jgi:hypothetical protein
MIMSSYPSSSTSPASTELPCICLIVMSGTALNVPPPWLRKMYEEPWIMPPRVVMTTSVSPSPSKSPVAASEPVSLVLSSCLLEVDHLPEDEPHRMAEEAAVDDASLARMRSR